MISKERFDAVTQEEGLDPKLAERVWFAAQTLGVIPEEADNEESLRLAIRRYKEESN